MFPITEILLAGSVTGGVVLGTTGLLILHAGAAKQEPDCDYIIVLGSKLEGGTPTATLLERIARAATYLNAHPRTKAILSGGEGEAACMFAALTAAGIDENRLTLEEKSTSTWQNLKFSLPLADTQKNRWHPIQRFSPIPGENVLKVRKSPYYPCENPEFPPLAPQFYPRDCRRLALYSFRRHL